MYTPEQLQNYYDMLIEYIKKNNSLNYQLINKFKNTLEGNLFFHLKNDIFKIDNPTNFLWFMKRKLYEYPKCTICGKDLTDFFPKCGCRSKGKNISEIDFKKYCSAKCAANSKETREKMEQTCLERYGVKNSQQNKEVREKYKKTCLEKYGNEKIFNVESVKRKREQTCLERYGVECAAKSQIMKEKRAKTIIKKYGSLRHSYEIMKEVMFKKYGRYTLNVSKAEQEIKDFIDSLTDYKCIVDRKILKGKELDGYIPEKKFAFEYNGLFWHSEKFKDENYHITKTLQCAKKGIDLIHIFENEWGNKIKKNIVKSIIKSKFDIFDNIVDVNVCKIKAISIDLYKNFFKNNCINGYKLGTKKSYGLFYNDELISSIGITLFKDCNVPIITFCDKINYKIKNSLNYLLEHSNYNEMILYVDLKYFNEKYFQFDKFILEERLKPKYIYVRGYNILKDMKTFKNNHSFDPSLSEVDNMQNYGYYRLFDCGVLKMKYIKQL